MKRTGLPGIPFFVVANVTQATAVFDARTSKNAYDMLAAQLMVAELNRAHGVSATCISSTINDANAMLIAAGYSGPGTTSARVKAAKTAVTNDTSLLDSFNKVGCM